MTQINQIKAVCGVFTSNGLEYISGNLASIIANDGPNIESIVLSPTQDNIDHLIPQLIKNLPNLKKVYIPSSVKSINVEDLRKTCPLLQSVSWSTEWLGTIDLSNVVRLESVAENGDTTAFSAKRLEYKDGAYEIVEISAKETIEAVKYIEKQKYKGSTTKHQLDEIVSMLAEIVEKIDKKLTYENKVGLSEEDLSTIISSLYYAGVDFPTFKEYFSKCIDELKLLNPKTINQEEVATIVQETILKSFNDVISEWKDFTLKGIIDKCASKDDVESAKTNILNFIEQRLKTGFKDPEEETIAEELDDIKKSLEDLKSRYGEIPGVEQLIGAIEGLSEQGDLLNEIRKKVKSLTPTTIANAVDRILIKRLGLEDRSEKLVQVLLDKIIATMPKGMTSEEFDEYMKRFEDVVTKEDLLTLKDELSKEHEKTAETISTLTTKMSEGFDLISEELEKAVNADKLGFTAEDKKELQTGRDEIIKRIKEFISSKQIVLSDQIGDIKEILGDMSDNFKGVKTTKEELIRCIKEVSSNMSSISSELLESIGKRLETTETIMTSTKDAIIKALQEELSKIDFSNREEVEQLIREIKSGDNELVQKLVAIDENLKTIGDVSDTTLKILGKIDELSDKTITEDKLKILLEKEGFAKAKDLDSLLGIVKGLGKNQEEIVAFIRSESGKKTLSSADAVKKEFEANRKFREEMSAKIAEILGILKNQSTSSNDTTSSGTNETTPKGSGQTIINNIIGGSAGNGGNGDGGSSGSSASSDDILKLSRENAELKQRLDNLSKEHTEILKLLKSLTDKVDELSAGTSGKRKIQQDEPTEDPTPKPKPTEDPTPKPKPTEDPTPKPKPTPKVRLIKKAIEKTEMLKEPKRPWYKRFFKFIARHPFRSAIIGIGVGAGLAVGGLVLTAFANPGMLAYIPYATLKIMGVGAAAGAGAGLLGSVLSRTTRRGRKERLYTKFQKKYKKCTEMKEQISSQKAKIELSTEKVQELREKHRASKGVLKSLGVYKFAKKFERKKLKKLRIGLSKKEEKYASKVAKAGSVKTKLNALEDATGKSMALGGAITKREKLAKKYMSGKMDKEDFQDELQDLEDDTPGLNQTSGEFKTFDTEMEELIEDVKSPSETMTQMLDKIERRNSKTSLKVVEEENKNTMENLLKIQELRKQKAIEEANALASEMLEQKAGVEEFEKMKKSNPALLQKLVEEFEQNKNNEP